MPVSLRNRT